MELVYFKTDTSRTVAFQCTPDGKIDFSELRKAFKLDLDSIELNGIRVLKEGLMSRSTWEQIESMFKLHKRHFGTEEDPVIVTGEAPAPIHGASTGMLPSRTSSLLFS